MRCKSFLIINRQSKNKTQIFANFFIGQSVNVKKSNTFGNAELFESMKNEVYPSTYSFTYPLPFLRDSSLNF